MSRRLRGDAPRMFARHDRAAAQWYGRHFRELADKLGPFDSVTRTYAGAVAALWVTFRRDTITLEDAQRARQAGRGRRPSTSAIIRLEKRQGLSWGSYDAALRRLEELSASRSNHDPLAAVRHAVAEANRR